MKAVLPEASERKVCRVLGVARSSLRSPEGEERSSRPVDELLAARVHRLIHDSPTFGYRRIWALLRYGRGLSINRRPSIGFSA